MMFNLISLRLEMLCIMLSYYYWIPDPHCTLLHEVYHAPMSATSMNATLARHNFFSEIKDAVLILSCVN